MEGGTDDAVNMLNICRTCHAILTSGNEEDAEPKDKAAYYHQVMYFGLEFYPLRNATRKGHEDRNYLKFWPEMKPIYDGIHLPNGVLWDEINDYLKQDARLKYQYFRDMGLGKWPWHDFEEYKRDFD